MASQVDIVPSLGHALLDTQGGEPGGYDAIDVRRARAIGRKTGVVDSAAYKPAPNPDGLAVDVDAHLGEGAVILGGSVEHQGAYVIAPHNALATIDLDPGEGFDRIDQIILEVLDADHDGGAAYTARLIAEPGTATSGATLDNRSGAADLSGRNFVRIADVLVPAGADAADPLDAANVRDRRPRALGFRGRKTIDTTLPWRSAWGTARVECDGETTFRVTVLGRVRFANATGAPQQPAFGVWLDGAPIADEVLWFLGTVAHATVQPVGGTTTDANAAEWLITPDAGSHVLGAGGYSGGDGSFSSTLTIDTSRPLPTVVIEEVVGEAYEELS